MQNHRIFPYRNFFGEIVFRTENGTLHGIPRSRFAKHRDGTHRLEVSPGIVLWLPVPDPDEFEVYFPLGKHPLTDPVTVPWCHLPADLPGLSDFEITDRDTLENFRA